MPAVCPASSALRRSPPISRALSRHRPRRAQLTSRISATATPGQASQPAGTLPAGGASLSSRCRSSSARTPCRAILRSTLTPAPSRASSRASLRSWTSSLPMFPRNGAQRDRQSSTHAYRARSTIHLLPARSLLTDSRVAGQAVQRLRSTLHVSNQILTVDGLSLQQEEGALEATGSYAFPTGRFSAALSGKSLSLSASDAANLPVDARFDVGLKGEGTLAAPQAQGFRAVLPTCVGRLRRGPRADGRRHRRAHARADEVARRS